MGLQMWRSADASEGAMMGLQVWRATSPLALVVLSIAHALPLPDDLVPEVHVRTFPSTYPFPHTGRRCRTHSSRPMHLLPPVRGSNSLQSGSASSSPPCFNQVQPPPTASTTPRSRSPARARSLLILSRDQGAIGLTALSWRTTHAPR